jgi:hypothetical protein
MSFLGLGGNDKQPQQNQVQTLAPWANAQPALANVLSEAQRLQMLGPSKYTPWGQVANFTPDQLAAQQGITNYTNSAGTQAYLQNGQKNTMGLLNQGMTGGQLGQMAQQGTGNLAGYLQNNNLMDTAGANNNLAYGNTINPYLQQQTDAALKGQVNQFNTQTLPGLRRNAIGDGSFGSTRNELTEGLAAGALNKQMNDTASGMYQNAYNTSEQNRLAALAIV